MQVMLTIKTECNEFRANLFFTGYVLFIIYGHVYRNFMHLIEGLTTVKFYQHLLIWPKHDWNSIAFAQNLIVFDQKSCTRKMTRIIHYCKCASNSYIIWSQLRCEFKYVSHVFFWFPASHQRHHGMSRVKSLITSHLLAFYIIRPIIFLVFDTVIRRIWFRIRPATTHTRWLYTVDVVSRRII